MWGLRTLAAGIYNGGRGEYDTYKGPPGNPTHPPTKDPPCKVFDPLPKTSDPLTL